MDELASGIVFLQEWAQMLMVIYVGGLALGFATRIGRG